MSKTNHYKHYEFLKQSTKVESNTGIYFIYGTDAYLKDMVMNKILKNYNFSELGEFDMITLYGDSNKENEIIEQLEMMPMMSEYRIVLIKNFELIFFPNPDRLIEYCKDPSKSIILIIMSEKIDKRQKLYSNIYKYSATVECKEPYDSKDIFYWLLNELRTRNIKMEKESIELFSNLVDKDYLTAKNELEKLIIFTGNKSFISTQDVLAAVGKSRTNNIFELQNALGVKDLPKSLMILENMTRNSEAAVFITTMLTRFFMILWRIQLYRQKKIPEQEIRSLYLKDIHSNFRNNYLQFASSYSVENIKGVFNLLLQADIELKSVDIKDEITLDQLIYKICKL